MDIPSTAPPHVPTTVALTNPANGGPVIYSAIYSGVPVYEMMCRDTPVMRRMADAYMNATQILKVAGFTKPKRTKILEREVLQGEHEKIQGGYGKYQGTWIPLSESRQLAGRYNVEVDLRALFDF
ncbi:Dna-binding domain of Mbp1, partial [Phlyctochytrium arcticum]